MSLRLHEVDRTGVAPPTGRWLSVGSAGTRDRAVGHDVGRQAALEAITGEDPRLLLVFCANTPDPAAVLAGIDEVAPGVPLIGCSSTVAIDSDGPRWDGVVIAALGGAGLSAATGAGRDAAAGLQEAGAAAAAGATDLAERGHQVLVLLADGQVLNHERILAGAYGVVGASMPYVGGAASPDTAFGGTYELFGTEVLTGGVVGAAIQSDGPFGGAVGHGWRRVGAPMIVTHSAGGDIYTLDEQPARGAYLDRLGAPEDAYTDPDAFMTFVRTRPIGIRRRSGLEIRDIGSDRFVVGEPWLRSLGEVPEGGVIWPMEGDAESGLDAAGDACQEAVAAVGRPRPLGLLAFDCIARRQLLGEERSSASVGHMRERSGGAPVAGFYTWGEWARLRGITGYHNMTLVVLAVG
ncbi:FIST signal transduction protein [Dactylosporangium cerinum]|uniref:FIST signal transduction protein n=1 Tax=Dactylosporangium cerinum TaxID=1434730 RepID=A0ABV9WLU3_9ACTN